MDITVIGSGYVGLVTAACLAELGNHVFCLDLDAKKIDTLNNGGIPIYEPGLEDLIERNRKAGRLLFSTDIRASVAHGVIQFIAVGTPPNEDGGADLQHVLAAANNIGVYMNDYKVVVTKSTVPVGTSERVTQTVTLALVKRGFHDNSSTRDAKNQPNFAVASNPEFLKEGAAVEDFMRPDRIIIGVENTKAGERAKQLLHDLYSPFNRNHERTNFMDIKSAEFTKYAANAMLATRISFMNELANLAEIVGADIELVRQGIGSDPRIGYSFLYSGTGYGGSCFPKDVQALIKTGAENNVELSILNAVESVNKKQKYVLVNKVLSRFGEDLHGKSFALWGLTFKPNTDDMRDAPSRTIIRELLQRGAYIQAYDPVAAGEAQRCIAFDLAHSPALLQQINYVDSPENALTKSDALIIATDWKIFKSPDFFVIKNALKTPIIFDGRNLYEPSMMLNLGIEYHGIGRKAS